jgi:hypothetical protein
MFAHLRTRPAAMARRGTASIRRQLVALGALLLVAGCTGVPPAPLSGPNPADPQARVAPAGYRSAFGGYVSRRPSEPQPWTQQNERVAPERKP